MENGGCRTDDTLHANVQAHPGIPDGATRPMIYFARAAGSRSHGWCQQVSFHRIPGRVRCGCILAERAIVLIYRCVWNSLIRSGEFEGAAPKLTLTTQRLRTHVFPWLSARRPRKTWTASTKIPGPLRASWSRQNPREAALACPNPESNAALTVLTVTAANDSWRFVSATSRLLELS